MKEEILNLREAMKCADKAISEAKERHRLELGPMEAARQSLRREMGTLLSGIKPGDILQNDKGQRVRVTSIYVSYGDSIDIYGINIRKDGTDGEKRAVHNYQHFKKIAEEKAA